MAEDFAVNRYHHAGYHGYVIRAGNRGVTRVVPPAGEDYAYDRQEWARRVEIIVSPTGRSVRVWVDGTEIPVSHLGRTPGGES